MCDIALNLVSGYLIEGVIIADIMANYDLFIERVKDIHKIGAIQGHLGWDQETIMPAKGGKARSEIMSWLAKEQHSRCLLYTSPSPRDAESSRMPSSA